MAGNAKMTIEAQIKLPTALGERVRAMAVEREMKLNDLLSELVHLGLVDLDKNPPKLELRRDYVPTYPDPV